MKLSNIVKGGFFVVAVAMMYEFLFVQGLFTSMTMMVATLVVGLANAVLALKEKNYNVLGLYVVATIALCMGYFKIMFLG